MDAKDFKAGAGYWLYELILYEEFSTNWSFFGAGVQVAEWRVCVCVCESDVTREKVFLKKTLFFLKSIYSSVPHQLFLFDFLYVFIFLLEIHYITNVIQNKP